MVKTLLGLGKQVVLEQQSWQELKALFDQELKTKIYPLSLENLNQLAQVVIVIGGDGTLLHVARGLAGCQRPMIGINRGRLGFLTQVKEGAFEAVLRILSGHYKEEKRILLEAVVQREQKEVFCSLALNEITISRGGQGKLIEFEVFINQEFVYTQRSDGLIIATPTGSTAYCLAAGGPILYATLPAFTLVPICPHSLSNRPVVINDDAKIEVLMVNGGDSRVHFDGNEYVKLRSMDRVTIRKYSSSLTLLQPLDYRYFKTLRQKLHWGEQLV
jgi:probable inorganic polyphosphate/ATP-NAD kinase